MLVMRESFLGRENPALTGELLEEAPGIFNWALTGLDRLNQRGYFKPSKAADEAMRQMEDLASPVGAFLRDKCSVKVGAQVPVDDLWTAWKSWCEDQGRAPGTKAVFGRDLMARAPTARKVRPRDGSGDRRHVYDGIALSGENNGELL